MHFGDQRPFMESVIRTANLTQKGYREKLSSVADGTLGLQHVDDEFDAVAQGLTKLDRYWRFQSARYWEDAIKNGNGGLLELARFASPRVSPHLPWGREFMLFWLRDVSTSAVPYHRVAALTQLYQQEHRVTHGNPNDINHALRVLDVEALVTADRAFAAILQSVSEQVPEAAPVVFVERSASDALSELRVKFSQAGFSI